MSFCTNSRDVSHLNVCFWNRRCGKWFSIIARFWKTLNPCLLIATSYLTPLAAIFPACVRWCETDSKNFDAQVHRPLMSRFRLAFRELKIQYISSHFFLHQFYQHFFEQLINHVSVFVFISKHLISVRFKFDPALSLKVGILLTLLQKFGFLNRQKWNKSVFLPNLLINKK